MMLVLVIHANVYGPLGLPTHEEFASTPVSTLFRCLTHAISIVCVNVFVLLSGYFGIRLSLRRVLSFIFQLTFWRVVSIAGIVIFTSASLRNVAANSFIPFSALSVSLIDFSFGAWFVGAYLGLMLLAPILNAFVSSTETRQLGRYVFVFLGVEMLCDWLVPALPYFHGGFSLVPLIGLYLCGAWLRREDCPLRRIPALACGLAYLAIAVGAASIMYIALWSGIPALIARTSRWFFPFSAPHALLGSVAFFLMFAKMDFRSRVVNWIAGSAFAVYLFHGGMPLYKDTTVAMFRSYSGFGYLGRVVIFIIGVFMVGILLDKVRMALWHVFEVAGGRILGLGKGK